MGFKVAQTVDLPGVSDYLKQALQNTEIQYRFRVCASEEEIIATAGDADAIIVVPSDQPIPKKVIDRLPKCRYILSLITGYDHVDVEAATEHGILVTNLPGLGQEEVADHTMALILVCSRRIIQLYQLVKSGEWVEDRMGSKLGREIWPSAGRLKDKTLGIVGFGRIARTLVPKARGFGMRLISFDPYVDQSVFGEFGVKKVEFDRLLGESDFVSILCPLTDDTRGMVGLEELKKMKPTAYIINTGRGQIIDRDALYNALTQGLIAGAGLDVTQPEPSNPENNPLVSLDNVIITAHSAGVGRESFTSIAQMAVEQVLRIAGGRWPLNIVNPEVKKTYISKWGNLNA